MSFNLSQLQSAPFRAVSGSAVATLDVSEAVLSITTDAGSDTILALPALASVRNRVFWLELISGGDDLILDPNGAETINGAASYTAIGGASGFAGVCIYAPPAGSDWWILVQGS